jgi:hypothetical protein
MKLFLRLLLPLAILTAVLLSRLGVIDAGDLLWPFLLAELTLTVYVLLSVIQAVRAARRHKAKKGGMYPVALTALSQAMPARVAAFAAMEPFLYWDILRWLTRRKSREVGTSFQHPLGQSWGPILAITWMLTPLEILLVELLIPWTWLRILLLIAGVWSILYITGLYASIRLRPHLLQGDTLRLRYGLFFAAVIPLASIAAVTPVRGLHTPRRSWGLVHGADGAAFLPGTDDPNIALSLHLPIPLANAGQAPQPVSLLYIRVSDPSRFLEAVAPATMADAPAQQ